MIYRYNVWLSQRIVLEYPEPTLEEDMIKEVLEELKSLGEKDLDGYDAELAEVTDEPYFSDY